MSSYVYIRNEPQNWTVGFYKPDGSWEPESDWSDPEAAAARVRYLNGGSEPGPLADRVTVLEEWMRRHSELHLDTMTTIPGGALPKGDDR